MSPTLSSRVMSACVLRHVFREERVVNSSVANWRCFRYTAQITKHERYEPYVRARVP